MKPQVTDIIENMQKYEKSLPDLFLRPSSLARLKTFGVEDLSEVAMADQIRKLQIQMTRVHEDYFTILRTSLRQEEISINTYLDTQQTHHPT